MPISKELIAKFIAATTPTNKSVKAEVVNATAVKTDDGVMVILDGADSQNRTPVLTTVDVKDGERVRVEIRDHQATIIGNTTSPAARSAAVADLSYIVSRSITTDELSAVRATISDLYAAAASIEELNALDLTAEKALIRELEADYGKIGKLTVTDIEGINAKLDKIKSLLIETNVLTTTQLDAVNGCIDNLKSDNASITSLSTQYANIGFENVDELNAQKLLSKTGIVEDLTIRDGVVSGRLVAVSISADNITTGSLAAERLMLQGEDGLYYRVNLNALGQAVVSDLSQEEQQALQNGIHGQTIIARTITANKIDVSDLSAFEATIAGMELTNGSIHTFAKNSVNNSTNGFYLDREGQFSLGNNESAIMFYKKEDGSYKLAITADEIRFGTSKKLISDAVNEVAAVSSEAKNTAQNAQDAIDNLEIGGTNLLPKRLTFSGLNREDGYQRTFEDASEIVLAYTDEILSPYVDESTGSVGPQVTISFDISTIPGTASKQLIVSGSNFGVTMNGSKSFIATDNFQRITWTSTIVRNSDGAIDATPYVSIAVFDESTAGIIIRNVQIEAGNRATDFKPAQEDIDGYMDELGASISKYKELLELMVMTPDGGTLLSQDANGVKMIFYEMMQKIAYIDSGVDENDNPYTTWGVPNGFQARVSNGSIQFLDAANVPMTTMDGDKMSINKVEADEEISIFNQTKTAKYTWSTRENGNMGLMWINI